MRHKSNGCATSSTRKNFYQSREISTRARKYSKNSRGRVISSDPQLHLQWYLSSCWITPFPEDFRPTKPLCRLRLADNDVACLHGSTRARQTRYPRITFSGRCWGRSQPFVHSSSHHSLPAASFGSDHHLASQTSNPDSRTLCQPFSTWDVPLVVHGSVDVFLALVFAPFHPVRPKNVAVSGSRTTQTAYAFFRKDLPSFAIGG